MNCPYTKEDVNKAIERLVKYFKDEKRDKEFFGLDDVGIIDVYLNWNEIKKSH